MDDTIESSEVPLSPVNEIALLSIAAYATPGGLSLFGLLRCVVQTSNPGPLANEEKTLLVASSFLELPCPDPYTAAHDDNDANDEWPVDAHNPVVAMFCWLRILPASVWLVL